jgi:hypothetical protein
MIALGSLTFLTSAISTKALAYDDAPPIAGSSLESMATITNTRDSSVATLYIILDSTGQVLGLYDVHRLNDGSNTVIRKVLTPEQIASDDGATLHEEQGFRIFVLHGQLDARSGKAALEIRYLTNALSGSYGACKINAIRSAQGRWGLYNAYDGKPVTDIRARTGILGVKTLVNVCPGTR